MLLMKPELRRELLSYALALAFLIVVAYAIELITSSLAPLGIDWYWWLGFGLFLLPFVLWIGQKKEPSHRRLPVERAEEIDLAHARYEYCSSRDSYLENKQLRRVA
jgi:amino acid transporter